jgi:hypothetical protein
MSKKAPAASAEASPASDSAPPQRRRLSLAAKVASAIIGVVGAVTGLVSILPIVFRDASSLDSLTVSVEPIESAAVQLFAVPLGAPWESFPVAEDVCSDDQLAWLHEHGAPMRERYLLEVTNTAKEGAMLSLKDFRGEGESGSPTEVSVAVLCDQSGVPSQLRAASLDPSSGGSAKYEQNNPNIPDNPLVYNLAPGETGQIAFSVRSTQDFVGQIVVTVSLGADERDTVLPFGDELVVPGVAAAPARFTVTDGRLDCVLDPGCVPLDVLARLAD